MKNILSRFTAVFLAVVLFVSMFPVQVMANNSIESNQIDEVVENILDEDSSEGEETTSSEGEETTPSEGEETTSSKGEETTSSEGEETTPSEGEETTSSEGEETTSSEGEETTPSEGEETTSSEGEETTPSEGEETSSSEGEEITSSEGEETTSSEDEETTPSEENIEVVIGENGIDSQSIVSGKFENTQLDIVSDKKSTLAPGVTENQYTVYDKNGDQVKMFVATADMSVDSVKLFASYNNMDPTNFGMSKLTEQVAAFNKKAEAGDSYYQGTVVAGINASYYNMTTGQPTGIFVMNGVVGTSSESAGYFAVMKDGSMKIGVEGDYAKDKDNIQEAIGIYQMLIVDGEICSGLNNVQKYPRQTIGITEDNKLIIMSADGNQAPTSVGLTVLEQAQVMIDLGCVWAGHLDGGGSMTYGSKPEGTDDFVITNNPSDGSERSVSNGFIIVSTAVTSYEFDHVVYDVENEYVTPGTGINVSVAGTSSTGNAADVPEGITYEVVNGTYAGGVFTAGNAIGDATITAMYNGKDVGTVTINVVNPDTISFAQPNMTVPYGKTVPFGIVATKGIHAVKVKESDFTITLSNPAMGAIDGFSFTACTEEKGIANGTMTAVLNNNTTVTATASITFGKGSEVIMDFENGSLGNLTIGTGYPQYGPTGGNGQNECGKIEIVTSETGKVHNGNYALAVESDFTQLYETGYHLLNLKNLNLTIPAKAQAVGAWLYIPEIEELTTTWVRFCGTDASGTAVNLNFWANGMMYGTEDEGWKYFNMDVSGVATDLTITHMQIYVSDRDQKATGMYFKDQASVNSRFTFYLDNITVDYSSAVDDREAPVLDSIKYTEVGMAEGAVLDSNTVTSNLLSFFASVKDFEKENATGLDASTAKAYIDGVEVGNTYVAGVISVSDVLLSDGVHTVSFEICDNMGNKTVRHRQITVNAGSDMTKLSLVPANPDATKILIGSLYWMNLNTTNVDEIETASMALNLNSVSQWELDNIVTAAGFTASYEYDYVTNNAVITITRTGDVEATGAATLAQLPIRTWESRLTEYPKYEDQTPEKLWSRKIIWPIDIKLSMDMGAITFTDGTKGAFSMAPVEVITEVYGNYAELNAAGDYSNKNSWHVHTAEAVSDKAATCTEVGYTGRTFCAVCNSIVDFGTKIPATGHTYTFIEGVLKCECGKLFNGIWEDGKEYVDGVCQADGWVGDSYYKDGIKLIGIQFVDGFYYNFGEDGVCVGKVKYSGLFYDESVSAWRYSKVGELYGGWVQIDDNWYCFSHKTKTAVVGERAVVGDVTMSFDEQGMTKGAWYTDDYGTRYYYSYTFFKAREPGYMTLKEIDGETYNFDANGYRTEDVVIALRDSTSYKQRIFEFAEDGTLVRAYTEQGIVECVDGTYYVCEDGYVPMNAGLIKYGDDYYYVVHSGKIKKNFSMTFTEENNNGLGILGHQVFDADGKMVLPDVFTGIREKDGIDYYWVDGEISAGNARVAEYEGSFYWVCHSGKIKKNGYTTVTSVNAGGLVDPGTYFCDIDGKIVLPDNFTGIREKDGVDYYWVDGEISAGNARVAEYEGSFYWVCHSGKIKKNGYTTVTSANAGGLIDPGTYFCDINGKIVLPDNFTGIREKDGVDYYWVDGEISSGNARVVEHEGSFYWVCHSGKIKKHGYTTVTSANAGGLVEPGTYFCDVDGKIAIN